jgi:hypothetical protein
MLRQTGRDGHLTDERYLMLYTLMEWIRVTEPASAPLTTPAVTH